MAKLNRIRKASLKSAACKPVTVETNGKEPEGLAARLSARVSKLGIVTRSMVELETGLPDKDESSRSSVSSLSSCVGSSLRPRRTSQSLNTCPVRRSTRIMQDKGKVVVKEEPVDEIDPDETETRPKLSRKSVYSEINCEFRQTSLRSCHLRSSGPAITAELPNPSCEPSVSKKRRRNELCFLLESLPTKHEQEDSVSIILNGDGETGLDGDTSIESIASPPEDEVDKSDAPCTAPRSSTPCSQPRPASSCAVSLPISSPASTSPGKANSLLLKLLNEPALDNGSTPPLDPTVALDPSQSELSTPSAEPPCSCPKGKRRTAVEALIQESERYINYPNTSSWRARSPFYRYNSRSRSIKASFSSSSIKEPSEWIPSRGRDKGDPCVPSPPPEDVFCSKFKDSDGVPSDTDSAVAELAAEPEPGAAKTTDSLLFSFEQVPCLEPWFVTYQRQDTNQLLPIYWPEVAPAPFLLPYEQSIEVILRRKGANRGKGKRNGPRNISMTSRGTISTRLQSQAALPSSGAVASSSAPTTNKSYHSNEYMRNRPRRVRKPTRKAHLLNDVPRMSPRCHASTLAIMSATGISRRDSLCDDSNPEPLPAVSQVESEADLHIIAQKLEDFLSATSPKTKEDASGDSAPEAGAKKRGRPRRRPLSPPAGGNQETKDQMSLNLLETIDTFRDVIDVTADEDLNAVVADVDILQLLRSTNLPKEEEERFCQELSSDGVAPEAEQEPTRPESVLTCNTEESDMGSTSTQSGSRSRGKFKRRRRNLTGWPKGKQRKRGTHFVSSDVADLAALSPLHEEPVYVPEKPKLIQEEETETEADDLQEDSSDSNENNPPVLVAEPPLFEGIRGNGQESLEPDQLEPVLSPVDQQYKDELELQKLEPIILAKEVPLKVEEPKSSVTEKASHLWLEKRVLVRSMKRRESRRRMRHPPDRLEYWPIHHRLRRKKFF